MKTRHTIPAFIGLTAALLVSSLAASANGADQWGVFECSFLSSKSYENPFTEVEVDVVFTQGDNKWKVPAFWAGDRKWTVRFAPPAQGQFAYRVECSDKTNPGLHGTEQTLLVTAYQGDNPLLKHGPLRVAANKRHFEHADGTPFFWLGDTWWKGLCKRLPWDGFQELTADRKKKGFSVVQIVCGTYPDEPGLLKPSWANEGGMPYLKPDFSVVNPAYFDYADRRIKHLVDAGIVPALVSGWGRAVNLNAVGLPGYKRHFRNLIARYGAYPVIWILGGETDKSQGPWHELAQYVDATDPYNHLLCNHTSHLRTALEGSDVFDFDMDATGHNSWATVNEVLGKTRRSLKENSRKPFVSGESCYELHMQENPAYLQRYQFWALMLAGAAGHTYGAAGVWHMATPEEHGNWGGWGGQPYDLTTWNEGMAFPGSAQLGRGKALLASLPWQQFEEHPEWVGKDLFAAGIPGNVRVIYQPGRGVYNWNGIGVNNLEPGTYSAFYFDPVSGRRYDLGVHHLAGTWKSPNVPSPQDWVLVLQSQRPGETVTLPRIKVGETFSGTLEPAGATFTRKSGPEWLTIRADGSYSGTPRNTNAGRNSFLLSVQKPGDNETLVELTIDVLGANGEVFVETFGGYQGNRNNQQADTALNVAHDGKVPGWTHSGRGAIHAVDRSFKGGDVTPSDWAIMIFEDNIITSPGIDANVAGRTYHVSFQASPAVYAQRHQATQAGDALLVEVLRKGGTVLKKFEHAPGAWNGKAGFVDAGFDYQGDGSGEIRLRIGPAANKADGRFQGAIDNISITVREAGSETGAAENRHPNPALEAAIKRLKIPGVTINLEDRCVDIEGKICLDRGMLELVACTKGTKEHESIVAIDARPMHIHTALLLLGAEAGNPAMRRVDRGDGQGFVDVPPKGSAVSVLLVFPDKAGKLVEHAISEFITRAADAEPRREADREKKVDAKFPTHTFLFAGSHLVEDGPGPRKYLSDESGDVISIVTFGDEMLCLPEIHSDQKESLEWQVNSAGLPAVGTKVILRLRPQTKTAAGKK
jgi:hypothetical protein